MRSLGGFFFLVDSFSLNANYLGLDIIIAVLSKREGREACLRRRFTSGLCHLTVIAEPLHVENAFKVGPAVSILLEKGSADILACLTDTLPRMEREVSRVLDRLPSYLFVIFVVEGKNATQKEVCDDTERPVVDFLAVRLLEKHLRGNIRQRAKRI